MINLTNCASGVELIIVFVNMVFLSRPDPLSGVIVTPGETSVTYLNLTEQEAEKQQS